MILDLTRLPILETERLRLSPLVASDASLLYPLMGDPEVMPIGMYPRSTIRKSWRGSY